jgi:hypothetical protein
MTKVIQSKRNLDAWVDGCKQIDTLLADGGIRPLSTGPSLSILLLGSALLCGALMKETVG